MSSSRQFLIGRLNRITPPSRFLAAVVLTMSLWLGITLILGYELYSSREREWNLARTESQNLTRLLQGQLTSTVEKLDLLLLDVVEDISPAMNGSVPKPDVRQTNLWLHSLQKRIPEILDASLRVVDADGNVVYQAGDDAELPPARIPDRDYFMRQKADTQAGLVMSEPLFSRFYADTWLLSFSRRLVAPNHRFVGIAMASLSIAGLQANLQRLNLGKHGVVGLYDDHLRLIARAPMNGGQTAVSYPQTDVAQALAADQTEGSFFARSQVDGVKRQYVFRRIAEPPMIVVAGRAPEDFMAEWNNKLALFAVSLAIMLGLICALALQLRRQERMARDHIDHLVTHDVLTELPNRLSLESQAALLAGEDPTRPMALMVLDIDNFKNINDTLGHDAGDLLLCAVAERLRGTLPPTTRLWRHGGDEFVILQDQDCAPEHVAELAECLLRELSEPMFLARQEVEVTASIGIALRPLHGVDIPDLLRGAEAAMYEAKSNGRAVFRFFSEDMRSSISERMLIENHLRKAIGRNQLRLFYQPQYDLREGRLVGFEALVRWQHPDMGLVSPARFIPVAEESGMIVPIGEWVFDEACRQSRQWQDAGLPAVPIAVNLAAQQFRRQDLMPQISSILRHHGLSADRLALEVTESSLMSNMDQVIATLERLKSLGLSIAIDDFGTGYSSLSYLTQFPIDKIKIDQSFVRGMDNSAGDDAIVQAVIAIAAKMRLRTIAEGVETRQQLDHLRHLGCDEVQGYYYSKPVPAAEAERFLRAAAVDNHCGTPSPSTVP